MEYEGLIYVKNNSGYTLDGVGTFKEVDLVIPSVLEGLPVTRIGGMAFQPYSSLKSVKFPETLVSIGEYSFFKCSLTEADLPANLRDIGEGAFRECKSLKRIIFPHELASVSNCVCEECVSLMSVVIPEGVTEIGMDAFAYCRSLRCITVPDSVTLLGAWVFSCCYNLANVVLGKRLERIGSNAFYQCERLKHIFYRGNPTDWKKLTIEERNEKDCLSFEILYFYSESVPEHGGKYWHYDCDGVPTIWGK